MSFESPDQVRDASERPRNSALTQSRPAQEEDVNGGAEIAWYISALQRRWILALAGAALGGIFFFGLASRQPPLYQGVTTVVVNPPSKPGDPHVNAATFRAMVENSTLAAQVVEELDLQAAPHALSPQRFVEDALVVEEIRGTNAVRVTVTLGAPQAAAEASRLMVDKAILLARQNSQKERESTHQQLTDLLADARDRLQQAEQAFLAFKQRSQIDLVEQDTTAMLRARDALLKLSVDIEGERARLSAAERQMKQQQPILSVPRSPAAEEALRAAPVPLGQANPQQLDLTNPVVNPVYQTLEYQIAMSRARIAALEQEKVELVKVHRLGDTERRLNELYRSRIEQDRLKASVDRASRTYGELAVRFEQSRTTVPGENAQLQVVDYAHPHERPVARKRVQKMAFGAAAGFVFTVAFILLWESRRKARGSEA